MTLDEQQQARAMAAARKEAERQGWIKPGERLPVNDEQQTGASIMVALTYNRNLAELRGESRPSYDWRAFVAERREAEARANAEKVGG